LRIGAMGDIETIKRLKLARGRDLVHSTVRCPNPRNGGSIKLAIPALDRRRYGSSSIRATEVMYHGERATRRYLEYRAAGARTAVAVVP
jgi:hypothetical protein